MISREFTSKTLAPFVWLVLTRDSKNWGLFDNPAHWWGIVYGPVADLAGAFPDHALVKRPEVSTPGTRIEIAFCETVSTFDTTWTFSASSWPVFRNCAAARSARSMTSAIPCSWSRTDRISAFSTACCRMPSRGKERSAHPAFSFLVSQTRLRAESPRRCPHRVAAREIEMPYEEQLAGRSMIVKKASPLPRGVCGARISRGLGAGRTTKKPAASAAIRCPPACASPTSCQLRFSPPRPRRPPATTKTSRGTSAAPCSATTWPCVCASGASTSTSTAAPSPHSAASSSPIRNSSSAWWKMRSCSSTSV